VDELKTYLDRWSLVLDAEPTRTPSGLIGFVRRGGEPAVLKLVNPGNDEEPSPAALRLWNGDGAVRLLEWEGRASLVERALPGTPLTALVETGRDDEATEILADLMAKVRRREPPPGDWPTLADWANGIDRQRKRAPHLLLPPAVLDRAEGLFRDLWADASERAFLHGDLHHYNVLRDEKRGWLVIDPKGVVGDPAFEIATALRNPIGLHPFAADPKVMSRRVSIYAERLALDRRRILGWAYGLMILSVCWHIEDHGGSVSIDDGMANAEVARSLL
jgi:streptomycin 6-kinase